MARLNLTTVTIVLGTLLLAGMTRLGLGDESKPIVSTTPEVQLTFGNQGILPCRYDRKVFAVYWRKGITPEKAPLIAILDQFKDIGERSGPGVADGQFNITDDFSLVIFDVNVESEGRYFCEVSDFESGYVLRNFTDVIVVAYATPPAIHFEQCSNKTRSTDAEGNNVEECIISTHTEDETIEIDCVVYGVKPNVSILWTRDGTEELNVSTLISRRNDGRFDCRVTLAVNHGAIYTCIARGVAVYGEANNTVRLVVEPFGDSGDTTGLMAWIIVLITMLVTSLFIFLVAFFIYLRLANQKKAQQVSLLIQEKRDKILTYTPQQTTGEETDAAYINLGLFGIPGDGKSELINILNFALTGKGNTITKDISKDNFPDRLDNKREMHILTHNLHAYETHGIVDFYIKHATRLIEISVRKQGKVITIESDAVNCPIFVYRYNQDTVDYAKEFITAYSTELEKVYGTNIAIMIAITHKSDLTNPRDIRASVSKEFGVPIENIECFDKLAKLDDQDRKESIIQYLDFILRCMEIGESNQENRKEEFKMFQQQMSNQINNQTSNKWIKAACWTGLVIGSTLIAGPVGGTVAAVAGFLLVLGTS